MRKIVLGVLLGAVAGLVDVVPMHVQNLGMDAIISAYIFWVVSGFFIASANIGIKGGLKGIVVAFLVLLPSSILIGWREPFSLVPIAAMTLFLGFLLGFLVEKYGK